MYLSAPSKPACNWRWCMYIPIFSCHSTIRFDSSEVVRLPKREYDACIDPREKGSLSAELLLGEICDQLNGCVFLDVVSRDSGR